ncbi:MAG: hypothetical protein R3F41_17835 [Gammaproteobacteria bacterium]|nr:hypothetical protein [Pseudomonadales bacterium]MCP5347410.1 hypothetical protein [Pseudomonadales bacterium]
MKEIYGMTFLELLIVAACISLLMSVVVPAYQASLGTDRIDNLALSADTRVKAIERAIARQGVDEFDRLNGGSLGIPVNSPATSTLHGAQVTNGEIVMTWKNDASFMQGVTYTLRPQKLSTPFKWEVGGSCVIRGFC